MKGIEYLFIIERMEREINTLEDENKRLWIYTVFLSLLVIVLNIWMWMT